MATIRVDGNDVLVKIIPIFFCLDVLIKVLEPCQAVYNASKEARRIAVEEHRPVLIEALTYRLVSILCIYAYTYI